MIKDKTASYSPKISIIVPVFNTYETLRTCVSSILKQTYTNYELIIVDDGSTDDSPQLCDELKKKDSRIKVIHKLNGGLSDARNAGIKIAKGENYLFIDSDDRIHEKFCEILMNVKYSQRCDIVSSDVYLTYDYREQPNINIYDIIPKVYEKKQILKEYFMPANGRIIYHGICMKLYDKKLFSEIWFERGRLHEDLFMTFQLLDRSSRFAFIKLPLYFYYQNPNSITHIYTRKNFMDEYDAISFMRKYFDGKTEYEEFLKKFVASHYMYLVTRSDSLKDDEEVCRTKKEIVKWIDRNVWNAKYINKMYAAIYETCCRFPGLYNLIIDLRNKVRKPIKKDGKLQYEE